MHNTINRHLISLCKRPDTLQTVGCVLLGLDDDINVTHELHDHLILQKTSLVPQLLETVCQ